MSLTTSTLRGIIRNNITPSKLKTVALGNHKSFQNLGSLLPACFIEERKQTWKIGDSLNHDVTEDIYLTVIVDQSSTWKQENLTESQNYSTIRNLVGQESNNTELIKDTILFQILKDVTISGTNYTLGEIEVEYRESVEIGDKFYDFCVIKITPTKQVKTVY